MEPGKGGLGVKVTVLGDGVDVAGPFARGTKTAGFGEDPGRKGGRITGAA